MERDRGRRGQIASARLEPLRREELGADTHTAGCATQHGFGPGGQALAVPDRDTRGNGCCGCNRHGRSDSHRRGNRDSGAANVDASAPDSDASAPDSDAGASNGHAGASNRHTGATDCYAGAHCHPGRADADRHIDDASDAHEHADGSADQHPDTIGHANAGTHEYTDAHEHGDAHEYTDNRADQHAHADSHVDAGQYADGDAHDATERDAIGRAAGAEGDLRPQAGAAGRDRRHHTRGMGRATARSCQHR